ncbi:MarR family winged helix-turn-helix transcriptional regulator [Chroococcus sp. FPU101]|uniref:MarR family winged helix-turn-helix transcriptional regulator n=1 Tax=Chroococcus sp. FPU101 TaxID=1974212 RepID=UPI001A8C6DCE|nr:MarR family transcriptional regulator [Chroococcus sp. FPU101]GFE69144.1 transcriptional regulator [Chroococcus sp. FPU101]
MTTATPQQTKEYQSVKAPYGLGYRIKILSQLMGRNFQEKLDPYGLTPFHWLVLCCLWEQDGAATSELCDRLRQVGGTLTGVVDRMEERGLVRRERDSSDRRVWRIWLTQEGRELEEVLPPLAWELCEQTMHGFSPQEREIVSKWINQMILNLS